MTTKRWVVLGIAGLLLVTAAVLWRAADSLVANRLRPATIRLLEARFNSHVELDRLDVSVFPTVGVRGERLVLRHRERADVPPLIVIKAFTIESGLFELWNGRIDRVHLDELHITIPPRRGDDLPSRASAGGGEAGSAPPDVHIAELVADNGRLTIASKRPDREPRVFELHHLRFESLRFSEAASFQAELSNPVPKGVIHTVGTFGPWNGEEPSLTPLGGSFRFDANLGTISGIGGDLHAEGSFGGPLDRIETEGRTQTKNFRLTSGGADFPLAVEYKATVDGTSGDTVLNQVEADLATSHISATGAIVKVEGGQGRRIALDTRTTGGRIEDFVRLTTRVTTSPLAGNVDVTATLLIPPGAGEVIDRLRLAGEFTLASATFTSETVQDKIDELSRRGRGTPDDESVDDVVSNMRGKFELENAVMRLQSLSFRVQGAEVRLAGTYGVRSEQLDFRGQLRLRARASETQSGWRSWVLKPFDPLLSRGGAGTVLPITIGGTRTAPKFGVEFRKMLLRQ